MNRRAYGRLLTTTIAATLWLSPTALADTTIDFDGFPPGTVLTNQYVDAGGQGQGVVFGPLAGTVDPQRPEVADAPGQATSGTRVADISRCPPERCGEVISPTPRTTGTFTVARTMVSVRVGFLGAPSAPCTQQNITDPHCAVVSLQAFDANGDPIGTPAGATLRRGAAFATLTVQTPMAAIYGFRIKARDSTDGGKPVAIDDLTFDVPLVPPPPDFSLTPASTNLVMTQGQTITNRISIGRLSGSSGDVELGLSGPLPAGVQAAFTPNPAGGTSSDLTLTAAPNAQATGFEPVRLTVTGTPSSSGAGAAQRSFPVDLQVRSAFDVRIQGPTDVDLAPCVVRVPVQVIRDFGFPGPVSLSVSGLANDVQASFEPGQITFPNGAGAETADLVVTGPATGRPVPPTTLTVRASAPPLPEKTATVTVGGTCPHQYDPRVTSLQITQGAQSPVLPQRYVDFPASPISYDEIPGRALLRRDAPTVVRVYANLGLGPPEGVANVPAVLHGSFRNSQGTRKPLPGSPLTPVSGTRRLQAGPPGGKQDEAVSETEAYTFVLPPEWTRTRIALTASLQASLGGSARAVRACESPECLQNDTMGLTGIPFAGARQVFVKPVELFVAGEPTLPDPSAVFRWTRMMTPVEVNVSPYQATIDISDIKRELDACRARGETGCGKRSNNAVAERVNDYTCDHKTSDRTWNIGVNTGVAHGLKSAHWCFGDFSLQDDAVVEHKRPMTSTAHEFGHLLGRPHADLQCGGNADGQTAEAWPPDNRGFLQSIGLATEQGTGSQGGPFAVIPEVDTNGKQWHDYMSYCAASTPLTDPLADGDAWVSVRGWNNILGSLDFERPVADVRPAQGPPSRALHVKAFAAADGTASIASVAPVTAPPQPVSQSPYRLVGLDASGRPIADVAMLEAPFHVDGEPPSIALTGVVPVAGVASVAIVRDGTTLATRARSANPPAVTLRGLPSFGRTGATVRWRASDGDGDDLIATIGYSADGGRSFEQVWSGPNRGVARVPARYLSRSSRARLRVTVGDGFQETSATSARFRSPGGPPVVRIISPAARLRQPNDAPLVLSGQAHDDADRALRGRSLTWFLGGRAIGTGERISRAGLPAGRHRVRLVARDRHGRTSSASVVVTLSGARPLFLTLSAPTAVGRTARSLRLRVASSLEATLVVTGRGLRAQRFTVDRKVRRATVRIPRGRRSLTLRVSLNAGRQTSRTELVVARR